MERYVETFFRHKWLFLFLIVLVPSLGIGYAFDQRQVLYQSTGTVWAEKPAYLTIGTDWNQYDSPAQNQSNNVLEFLQTNSFAVQALQQTDLQLTLTTAPAVQTALDNLRKRVVVKPIGTHLLAVSYSDEQPKVAEQVVQAIIDSFNKQVLVYATSDGSVALTFYQKQLDDANAKLADATAALRAYLSAHPEVGQPSIDPASSSQLVVDASFAAKYPELVRLIQAQDTATKAQQQVQSQVTQIEFSQGATSAGTSQSFRIMDAPSIPTKAVSSLRKFGLQIGLAVGAAVGFIAAALIILTLSDRTVRNAQVVIRRFPLPVGGVVPLFRTRRTLIRRRVRQREVLSLLALGVGATDPTQPGS